VNVPFALLLIFASIHVVVSIVTQYDDDDDDSFEKWTEGIGIWILLLVNAIVSGVMEWYKSRKLNHLESLKQHKNTVRVIRNNQVIQINSEDVVVGDLVYCQSGDTIPADGMYKNIGYRIFLTFLLLGIYVRGFRAVVNTSSRTGESTQETIIKTGISPTQLYYPCTLIEGSCVLLVCAVGQSTQYAKTIVQKQQQEQKQLTIREKRIKRVANVKFVFGTIFAFIVFVVYNLRYTVHVIKDHNDHLNFISWYTLITFLRAAMASLAIICLTQSSTLVPIMKTIFALNSNKMVEESGFIPSLKDMERIAAVTELCINKSVLVQPEIQVTSAIITEIEYNEELPTVEQINKDVLYVLSDAIALNSTAEVYSDNTQLSFGNPEEIALVKFIQNLQINYSAIRADAAPDIAQVYEFSHTRMRGSTVIRLNANNEYRVFTKGAAEVVYALCNRQMEPDGQVVEISDSKRIETGKMMERMTEHGQSPICIAFNDFHLSNESELEGAGDAVEHELICIAILGIKQQLIPDVEKSINKCQQSGIRVRLLTGEHPDVAKYISTRCRILSRSELLADGSEYELESNDIEEAQQLQVLSRCTPANKQAYIQTLLDAGHSVACTVSHFTDVAIIQNAAVSIVLPSLSILQTDNDLLSLLSSNFTSIMHAKHWGHQILENIRKIVQFQLTSLIVLFIIQCAGLIIHGGMVFSPSQILWIHCITNALAVFVFAVDYTEDLSDIKPVKVDKKIITGMMWIHIAFQSIYQITLLLCLLFGHSIVFGAPDDDNDYSRKRNSLDYTLVFNVYVFCQLFNSLNTRTVNNEVFVFRKLFHNRLFIVMILASSVLQALFVEIGPFLGLKTYGLSWLEWIVSVLSGCIGLLLSLIVRPMVRFIWKKYLPRGVTVSEDLDFKNIVEYQL
jgi:calcium-translocating P-type ATPase